MPGVTRPRQARWDEADLAARLCRALEIAGRVLELFAASGYADVEVSENNFRPEKPIAETAILIYAASGARHFPDVADRMDALARLLIPHARSERVLVEMALHPALCLHFAAAHILLTRLGYRDPDFDELVGSCMRSHVRNSHERAPSGSLEQRWLLSLWTDEDRRRGWRTDLRNSSLYHPIDILGGVREDGYALTHLLMYCSDFGFCPSHLPRKRSIILAEAGSLLAKCLDTEDYDLAGEVLMAWPLTGARWSPSATFGFRVLARIEDQVGVLPGATTKADRLNRLEGDQRQRYALGTAYHTAYVMGMLCAASLLPGRAPPIGIPRRQAGAGFVDRLLPYLGQDQGHWQTELSEMRRSERDALALLLLDVAITQQCRKRAYTAVGELLSLAHEYDMASTPLCGQAAELIERLAVCSRTIGILRRRSGNVV